MAWAFHLESLLVVFQSIIILSQTVLVDSCNVVKDTRYLHVISAKIFLGVRALVKIKGVVGKVFP